MSAYHKEGTGKLNGVELAYLGLLGAIAPINIIVPSSNSNNMKYEYKMINPLEEGIKDGKNQIGYDLPSSEWRFVGVIENRVLMFEKIIEEQPSINIQDTQTSGTK